MKIEYKQNIELDNIFENAIKNFNKIMIERLYYNRNKGNWKGCSLEYLSRKLTEEFSEVQVKITYCLKDKGITENQLKEIILEVGDLANICMFISELKVGDIL